MSKLTLSINNDVVKRAQHYARRTKRSLSEIVESYLDRITQTRFVEEELNELPGVDSKESFDNKEEAKRTFLDSLYGAWAETNDDLAEKIISSRTRSNKDIVGSQACDFWNTLSEEQKQEIEISRDQIKRGDVISWGALKRRLS